MSDMLYSVIVCLIPIVAVLLFAWRGSVAEAAEKRNLQPIVRDNSHLNEANFALSESALKDLISSAEDHDEDPQSHIHRPAGHPNSHSWLASILPKSQIEKIEEYFHMGNYVIDRETGEKTFEEMSVYVRIGMHLLYYGSQQSKVLHWKKTLALLQAQSEKMGKQYDSPESKSHIWPFIKSFKLESGLHELKEPDPDKYETFNEFFAREIREDARPVHEPENHKMMTSPADCRMTAFPSVDLATKYWIKGFGFNLEKLLGSKKLAQHFDGGAIVIARLAPQDYHRWHAPVSGTVVSVTEIPGAYYTVNPQAINEAGTLDVFCENRRSVMTIKRDLTGSLVAIVAVGAMLVGSIKYVGDLGKVGAHITRGQCLGAFYYGGSTVIVLYPKGEVKLDDDIVKNSTEHGMETYMKVGWRKGSDV
jgi:phosphatidylserine decarboxylase